MSAFTYRDGVLCAESVPLEEIAEAVGTPAYVYSSAEVEGTYHDFAEALAGLPATICYAVKANGNLALIGTLGRLGAGADVVSEGELRRALAAGIPADKIVFAGVGKTAEELAFALDCDILQFNVESLPELELLNRIALEKGRQAPVALRINPDVDAGTHAHISTGRADHKFGIDIDLAPAIFARAHDLAGISLQGIAVHIGSQLLDLAPFRAAFARSVALYQELRAEGFPLRRLDLGGGLGIVYRGEERPDLRAYAGIVREATAGLDAELIFEPGRLLVGNAGVLLTRVIYLKEGASRRYAIVDAAMNDLIRPMLYEAWHEILPAREAAPGADPLPVDVVGPICETTDTFARGRLLPPLAAGALLTICSAGAYSAVMSSSYNARLPAPEVLVRGDRFAVVRPRPDHEALISQDRMPDWIEGESPRRSMRSGVT